MKLLAILLLLPAALLKIILVMFGLVAVPFTSATHGLYRAGINRPHTYWERAIRNPVGGIDYLIKHPETWTTSGTDPIEPTAKRFTKHGKRFTWRFRHSGLLCSIRLVWYYSVDNYGELYLGWKLGSDLPRLDFAMSLRPYAEVGQ